jgi:predicted chitinase
MKKQENVSYILSSKDIFKMARSSWNKGKRVLLDAGDATPIPEQTPVKTEPLTKENMQPPSEMTGGISDIVRSVLKELGYGEQGIGAVAQGQGGFQDPDEPVSTTGTWGIAAEEEAVQVPSVTAEQRTALSDLGSDVNRVNLEKITNARGNYSPQALTNAIDRGIRNTNKKALLKGASQTEIGNRGLVREGTSFSLRRAYEVYNDRIVNDALQSLPQAEQNRINRGEASDALGIAIHDRAYDGGSNYAGRGLIQLTHRRNYQAVQTILENNGINIDLVNNPDLANDTRYALPIAIAYLQHTGLTDEAASNSSAKDLQNRINPSIGTDVAEERWGNVIQALRDAGEDDEANRFEKRNEYAAQRRVGFRGNDIDGIIGTNSDREMRRWLTSRNVNIPANATGMDLVVLVNSQP